jgi:protein SCO1/2
MTPRHSSRLGEDLLGPGGIDSSDGAGADEVPVVGDGVLGGPPGDPAGAGGGLPVGTEDVPGQTSRSVDDGTGHDPLDVDFSGVAGVGDGHSAGVFDPVGIDAVDDVRPDDARPLLQLAGETRRDEESEHSDEGESAHGADSTSGLPRVFKWLLGLGAVVVAGVLAFAVFEPVQVLPRVRVAPGFAFIDGAGESFTSEDGRRGVTLYTFAPVACGPECVDVAATMREVGHRVRDSIDLGGAEFRMVTIALDSNDPSELARAAASSGADGETWTWVGGVESEVREVVGGGFGVYYDNTDSGTDFDPVFVIVDGAGLIRGEYRYATLASDADRLTRHISLLGEELRNSKGAGSLVYEAAHILLCYP